jgi:hypothetical protein
MVHALPGATPAPVGKPSAVPCREKSRPLALTALSCRPYAGAMKPCRSPTPSLADASPGGRSRRVSIFPYRPSRHRYSTPLAKSHPTALVESDRDGLDRRAGPRILCPAAAAPSWSLSERLLSEVPARNPRSMPVPRLRSRYLPGCTFSPRRGGRRLSIRLPTGSAYRTGFFPRRRHGGGQGPPGRRDASSTSGCADAAQTSGSPKTRPCSKTRAATGPRSGALSARLSSSSMANGRSTRPIAMRSDRASCS